MTPARREQGRGQPRCRRHGGREAALPAHSSASLLPSFIPAAQSPGETALPGSRRRHGPRPRLQRSSEEFVYLSQGTVSLGERALCDGAQGLCSAAPCTARARTKADACALLQIRCFHLKKISREGKSLPNATITVLTKETSPKLQSSG